MTNRDLIVKLAALLSTLRDEPRPVPASTLYLALGCDMESYRVVSSVGERSGWLKVTPNTIALTAAGKAKARELEALGV
jgi:hypothetical protein